jgi:hypothetical protein
MGRLQGRPHGGTAEWAGCKPAPTVGTWPRRGSGGTGLLATVGVGRYGLLISSGNEVVACSPESVSVTASSSWHGPAGASSGIRTT